MMRCAQRGLTLIELMTVVAVLAVVAALAAPGMRDFAAGQRVKAMATDLASDLVLARNEALKRQRAVTLTPQADGWASGWTVAIPGEVLARRGAGSEDIDFAGAPALITFNLHGRVADAAAGARIEVSSNLAGTATRRCVELDLSGRARMRTGACA